MRILLPAKARDIVVTDAVGSAVQFKTTWDELTKTCLIAFESNPDGVRVKLSW
jgi:hypothetical protein